ncbi:MAG: hypothetical protein LBL23_02555 [Coriobacteriales bacterium]|nr:hypothetical protein [Coriobacteriales bacterium]
MGKNETGHDTGHEHLPGAAQLTGGHAGLENVIRARNDEIGRGYVLGGTAAVPAELLALLEAGAQNTGS